ncbi:MAG TPA: metalloregulator ArsR/SmtB family transcription factor [Anaerolineales bacterium]|nr:metalloregulator ArsR/SmtB family transcription factor [Anaerolineales bacterium]
MSQAQLSGRNGYQEASALLKALSHPVRLQILQALAEHGEACVCHLECALGRRQAYISQQLSRLRENGIVVDRREGLNVFYRLADPAIPPLLKAIRLAAAESGRRQGRHLSFEFSPAVKATCNCPQCAASAAVPAG